MTPRLPWTVMSWRRHVKLHPRTGRLVLCGGKRRPTCKLGGEWYCQHCGRRCRFEH